MVITSGVDSNPLIAKWIGECIPVRHTAKQAAHLLHRPVKLYTKCIFGALTLQVGDFVLVSNVDAAEPDTVDGCDVARLVHLYELHDVFAKDPYRGVVQWYSRPHSIPHQNFDSDDVNLDFDAEVIEDHRPYDADISLETIYAKCDVVRGSTTHTAESLLRKCGGNPTRARFACRYKYVRSGGKRFQLLPLQHVLPEQQQEEVRNSRRLTHSASKSATRRTQPKRRASTHLQPYAYMEFIDMSSFQNKVSPIKIVGGRSVVRMSSSASATSAKKAKADMPASPLAERNVRVTPTQRAVAARRNLNLSLDKEAKDSTAGSDCLNYSIVDVTTAEAQTPATGELKIKLRLSERRRTTRLSSSEDPLHIVPAAAAQEADAEVDALAPQQQRKRLGAVCSTPADVYHTPSKKARDGELTTPSTHRKSILKSVGRRLDDGTPRRSIQLSNIVEQRVYQEDDAIMPAAVTTPKRGRKPKIRDGNADPEYTPKTVATTPRRSAKKAATTTPTTTTTTTNSPPKAETPATKLKRIRCADLPANMEQRADNNAVTNAKTDLQMAREQLHVSVVPSSLPCREREFHNVQNFLECKIRDQCGGCMYVSGVPGTGKTATVTSVIRELQARSAQQELPPFEFLEINGMRLTEPRQAYVHIYRQLTGKTVSWEHAHALLEKRFTTAAPRRVTTVLLVDELDILCNRRQDVVYNLLDWPTKSAARLVVVTIANTMDLPERLLMGKVTSRLGLTRLTFQPYTYKQLEAIVVARLSGGGAADAFKGEAVQLVARKVAAVSGDARRALDICRRATEVADAALAHNVSQQQPQQKCVTIVHVQQALAEMIASAKVQAIKNCSRMEQLFLRAVVAEVTRTGVEETNFMGVYTQLESIAAFEGVPVPAPGRCLRLCSKLGAERLLIGEHSRMDLFQKILLNVSTDDIHYALQLQSQASF